MPEQDGVFGAFLLDVIQEYLFLLGMVFEILF